MTIDQKARRSCVECSAEYVGPLACPKCGAPGEPLPSAPPVVFVFEGRPMSWARTATHNGRRLKPKRLRVYQRRIALQGAAVLLGRRDWPGDCPDTRFRVRAQFYLPDRRRCDLDNLIKAIADALEGIAWRNDHQIDELIAEKSHGCDGARSVVQVEVIE